VSLHRNCVTDPLTKQWWRDYQKMCRTGNRYGLSFTDYITRRTISITTVGAGYATGTDLPDSLWFVATCGHKHPWGESCATVTEA
jgi:hypothetical protein